MVDAPPKRLAATRLFLLQAVVFTALGWVAAGILDAAGALRLADALFVAGLLLACGAGLIALEGSDAPLAPRLRAAPTVSMAGIADRAGLGIPLTRAQALAVVSAVVSAAGLIAAGIAGA